MLGEWPVSFGSLGVGLLTLAAEFQNPWSDFTQYVQNQSSDVVIRCRVKLLCPKTEALSLQK